MNYNSFFKWYTSIRNWNKIFYGKKKFIFVVSHMRSRSSLLSHILGSHSEVSGYAETSQPYESIKDLKRLRYDVWCLNSHNLEGRYVLDKVLHNRYSISASVLEAPAVRVCYLLRRPEATLQSIMQLSKLHKGASIWVSPEQAVTYYVDRIECIMQYVQHQHSHCRGFFVESDELIENTDSLLMGLSEWLLLSAPLTSHYDVFDKTGKSGFGDPSGKILEGKVILTGNSYEDMSIPAPILADAREIYDRAKRIIQKQCVRL